MLPLTVSVSLLDAPWRAGQVYDYLLAENITKKLLEKGLVSVDEFNKIMAKNRESFSPFFARI